MDPSEIRSATYRFEVPAIATAEGLVNPKSKWVDSFINNQNFPFRKLEPGKKLVEFLDFTRKTDWKEVLVVAKSFGLKIPTYEDALCFNAYSPDCPGGFLIFPHEQVEYLFDDRVICLCRYGEFRLVQMTQLFDPKGIKKITFNPGTRLAFLGSP